MIISVLIFALIWSSTSFVGFVLPTLVLSLRMLYIGRPLSKAMLLLPITAGVVAFLIWYLASGAADVAAIAGLRSALTALLVVHILPASDRLINTVTIRIPILRDVLLVVSRTVTFVRQIFEDVLYTYRFEARRTRGVQCVQLLVASFAILVNEIIEFIERLALVVESRGRYPSLHKWYEPVPIRKSILFLDLVVVALVLLFLAGTFKL